MRGVPSVSTTPAAERGAESRRLPRLAGDAQTSRRDLGAVLGGAIAIFLLIFWSVDDGGTDARTWYWGALLTLAGLAVLLVLAPRALASLPRAAKLALGLFALFTAWSYLSMTWAAYPGLALEGSNRTLLYLLLFTFMAALPWRQRTALVALGFYGAAVGVIAVALLFRFALGTHIPALFYEGRMVTPTGYFNSNAALFTIGALVAIGLAARRGVTPALRGLFVAFASADLMLAFTPQSRGWLFTLPIVGLYAAVVMAGRVRSVAVALPAAAGLLIDLHPLLRLFQASGPRPLTSAAIHAGKIGLLTCAGVFAVATLVAMIESARGRGPLSNRIRGLLGTLCVALAVVGMLGGLWVVSKHHPASFISRQWHGFTREPTNYQTSDHFLVVGSGRYDFWRSALDAFKAHPIGGLGQDNFGDWYLTHRHTTEEPLWPHSLELRLLSMTGIVGLVLFAAFLIAALAAAAGARRRGEEPARMLVGAALLPLGVWLIHGSIDWFWEFPALSGPALGFLAMACRLLAPADELVAQTPPARAARVRRRLPTPVLAGGGLLALLVGTAVLGFPFLAIHELDLGITQSSNDVSASLADFRTSHQLNPLMSDPGTLAGSVALVNGRDAAAATFYRQAVTLEPGDWIAWLGRGLAASTQGEVDQARADYRVAMHLDSDQPAVQNAWKKVGTAHPLTPQQAFAEIDSVS